MESRICLDVMTMYFIFLGTRAWKGFAEKQRCRDIGTYANKFTSIEIARELLKEMKENKMADRQRKRDGSGGGQHRGGRGGGRGRKGQGGGGRKLGPRDGTGPRKCKEKKDDGTDSK